MYLNKGYVNNISFFKGQIIENKRKSIYANTENELKIVWKLLSENDDNELYWVD